MSHDLEVINGEASFASRNIVPWHKLGQVFTGEKNSQEILELANLNDWNVRGIELEDFLANTDIGVNIKKQIIIRDNPAYIEGGLSVAVMASSRTRKFLTLARHF